MTDKEIPVTKAQWSILNKINKLLIRKVKTANQLHPYYRRLDQEINKNQRQKQDWECHICHRVFKIVNQRSAHMNKHKNEEKRAKLAQQKREESQERTEKPVQNAIISKKEPTKLMEIYSEEINEEKSLDSIMKGVN